MLNIARFCIDSGFESQMVYRWVREQHTPDVMAVDGRTSLGGMTVGQPSPVDVGHRRTQNQARNQGVAGRYREAEIGTLRALNLPKPEDGNLIRNGYLHPCRRFPSSAASSPRSTSSLNNKGYRIHQWEK